MLSPTTNTAYHCQQPHGFLVTEPLAVVLRVRVLYFKFATATDHPSRAFPASAQRRARALSRHAADLAPPLFRPKHAKRSIFVLIFPADADVCGPLVPTVHARSGRQDSYWKSGARSPSQCLSGEATGVKTPIRLPAESRFLAACKPRHDESSHGN